MDYGTRMNWTIILNKVTKKSEHEIKLVIHYDDSTKFYSTSKLL